MEKIKLHKYIHDLDPYILQGNMEGVISNLTAKLDELKKQGYENIKINRENWEEEYSVVGDILETDEEFEHRIKSKEAERERVKSFIKEQEDKERKTYEKLKAKFDGK